MMTRALRCAVWLGLMGGMAELVMIAARKTILHRFVFVSPYVVWMTPVADAFLATVAVAALLIASRFVRRVPSPQVQVFPAAFTACLSPLLMYGPLHHFAAVLLAGGLATQISRALAAHAERFDAFIRRSLAAIAVVILALTAAVYGNRVMEDHMPSDQVRAAAATAPNVLLIVLDTVRAQDFSLYGYARATTPYLDGFARAGVWFEHAFATAPWTLPSHASMFTGRPAHELSTTWMKPLDAADLTLAEVLRRQGYATAGFVANVTYCSRETGLNRGFGHYEDRRVGPQQILLSSCLGRQLDAWLHTGLGEYDFLGRKSAAQVNREFLAWLAHQGARPFFAFLNYFDAHEPHMPPPPFDRRFGPPREPRTVPVHARGFDFTSPDIHSAQVRRQELDAYDGSIAYMDDQIRQLLTALDQRKLMDNTLVIITADHGEELGEHGGYGHGDTIYWPELHVPLLMSFPKRTPAGAHVSALVSLSDLPATILDLLQVGTVAPFPGRSLARYWNGTQPPDAPATQPVLSEVRYGPDLPLWFPSHHPDLLSLVDDRYHYIKHGDGGEELYDWQQDPAEQHDRAGSTDSDEIMQTFRTSLNGLLASNSR